MAYIKTLIKINNGESNDDAVNDFLSTVQELSNSHLVEYKLVEGTIKEKDSICGVSFTKEEAEALKLLASKKNRI